MKLSKREKFLLIFVLIIGCAVAYYLIYYQPTTDEINKLNTQIKSNQSTIKTNELLKKQIAEYEQGINDDKNQIDEFSDSIESAFDQPPVLVYLSELIKEYGFKFEISFDESEDLGQVNYSRVFISMIGKYDDLKNMLKDLSEGEYFVKVVSLVAINTFTVVDIPVTSEMPSDEPEPTSSDSEPTPAPTFAPSFDNQRHYTLSIELKLEFYNIGDNIPPDKVYDDFTGGAVQYGGDIFG